MNEGGPLSRILLPDIPVLEAEICLSAAQATPLYAWRARPGEVLIAEDHQGTCYRTRVAAIDRTGAALVPFAVCPSSGSPLRIEVYQAIPERERFELILQKLTELGVSRVVPFTSQHSSTREARDAKQKKSHRWPEVILRAARQCRRIELPELLDPQDWESCLQQAAKADLALLLYEGEARQPIREVLQAFSGGSLALLVGPEGGFTDAEVAQSRQLGIQAVGLGPRILRTETAAISAMTIVQYELGDLGTG